MGIAEKTVRRYITELPELEVNNSEVVKKD
ncbi:MAG: hypothetical protein MR586_00550 [Megasphaera elsdenii]|nr:hypothetical protein [Megasphaera elsdenii]